MLTYGVKLFKYKNLFLIFGCLLIAVCSFLFLVKLKDGRNKHENTDYNENQENFGVTVHTSSPAAVFKPSNSVTYHKGGTVHTSSPAAVFQGIK
ncbi:Hypothetical predicted protein [Paramuricea clavata]|uniref:Uncharacterized protein n=1 Tax=Paramuricea clavata TaxID=317549 RepID=A0A6S7JID7_PARCT|nr:Hypothetical predicted protein [Paramuricea clavata]